MMTRKRIIPMLLWRATGLVKGVGFDNWRNVGPLMPVVKVLEKRDVDEVVIVNLDCSEKKKELPLLELTRIASQFSCPLTFGGGISSLHQIEQLFKVGFDRVLVNSALFENPKFLSSIVKEFGSQSVVTSIDVRIEDVLYQIYKASGKVKVQYTLDQWCEYLNCSGIGEVIVNSIDSCGTLTGFNLELLLHIKDRLHVNIVAGCGAGSKEDLLKLFSTVDVNAACIGSLFHFTQETPNTLRNYLHYNGINTRQVKQL